jgi:hypothetical protein
VQCQPDTVIVTIQSQTEDRQSKMPVQLPKPYGLELEEPERELMTAQSTQISRP